MKSFSCESETSICVLIRKGCSDGFPDGPSVFYRRCFTVGVVLYGGTKRTKGPKRNPRPICREGTACIGQVAAAEEKS